MASLRSILMTSRSTEIYTSDFLGHCVYCISFFLGESDVGEYRGRGLEGKGSMKTRWLWRSISRILPMAQIILKTALSILNSSLKDKNANRKTWETVGGGQALNASFTCITMFPVIPIFRI